MAHKGTVTLYTPQGEAIVWEVDADPVMSNGCCTFMQEADGKSVRVRVMGTVVAEVFDTRDERPGEKSRGNLYFISAVNCLNRADIPCNFLSLTLSNSNRPSFFFAASSSLATTVPDSVNPSRFLYVTVYLYSATRVSSNTLPASGSSLPFPQGIGQPDAKPKTPNHSMMRILCQTLILPV